MVVVAVRKAVRAATMTFTATSTIRFFMRHLPSRLVAVRVILVTAFALTEAAVGTGIWVIAAVIPKYLSQ